MTGQTMVPPSIHPNGELLEWEEGRLPDRLPLFTWSDVEKRAKLLALSLISLAYPRVAGNRDTVCLALAGTLVAAGFTDEEVVKFIVAVAQSTGDEEADSRGEKAACTRKFIVAGEPCMGLPKLCDEHSHR